MSISNQKNHRKGSDWLVVHPSDPIPEWLPIPDYDGDRAEPAVIEPTANTTAPEVQWADGSVLPLPWLPKPNEPLTNLLAQDESHVRQLATSGKRAVDADWIKALQYTTFEDAQTAAFHIKENIAQANIIILDGCPYDAVLLELDQLETAFNLHAASRVTVQDSVLRCNRHINTTLRLPLGEFCRQASRKESVQAVFASMRHTTSDPEFIKFIDEGYSSWHLLGGYFPECTLIPVDVQRARAWIMLLHAGYYSCARIVPDGCCSWAQILSGTVQWIFHRPRLDNPNRRDLHLATENYRLAYDTHGGHVSEMETFTVSGKPGTIIIIPPGSFHELYAATSAVVIGGHFYTANTMHLTEITRGIERRLAHSQFSQPAQSGTWLTLVSMMCAIPYVVQHSIGTKSLTAWCRMLKKPSEYALNGSNLKDIPDGSLLINHAKMQSTKLMKGLNLDDSIWNYKSMTGYAKPKSDFIFDAGSWFEPGVSVGISTHVLS